MKRWFFLSVFFIIIFCSSVISCVALDSQFVTTEITEAEQKRQIQKVDFQFLTEEPIKRTVNHFALREDGTFAVVSSPKFLNEQTVSVYSSNGAFLYGYSFYHDGAVDIEWGGDCLNLLMHRSYKIFSLDNKGTVLGVAEYVHCKENTHYERRLDQYTQEAEDGTYRTAWKFPIIRSQIIKTDRNGIESVVYQTDAISYILDVIFLLAIIAFCVTVIHILIREIKKEKNCSKSQTASPYVGEKKQADPEQKRLRWTRIAIIAQCVSLHIAIQPFYATESPYQAIVLLVKYAPLLLSTIWMAYNLLTEKKRDPKQFRTNVYIESVYFFVMAGIALVGYFTKSYYLSFLINLAVQFLYISVINPRYMKRKLIQFKWGDTSKSK